MDLSNGRRRGSTVEVTWRHMMSSTIQISAMLSSLIFLTLGSLAAC